MARTHVTLFPEIAALRGRTTSLFPLWVRRQPFAVSFILACLAALEMEGMRLEDL